MARKVMRSDSPNPVADNRAFHRLLTDGVPVEYRTREGAVKHGLARLFDLTRTGRNDWLVVNQLTVQEGAATRRPDLVVFVNGDETAPPGQAELQVVIEGVFAPERFLDLVRHFVVFEDDGETVVKKMAAYHQFDAVNKAVEATVTATAQGGDGARLAWSGTPKARARA